MTVLPAPPRDLLTVGDYAALDEDDQGRCELQEGNLVMSPSPTPRHMLASGVLRGQLAAQLPPERLVIQDVDVDLGLGDAAGPGWVRRPDLVVVERSAVDRVEAEGGLLRAGEVLLVVEIVSPGSRRTDHVIKRGEYADAGIEHYWIVDVARPTTLLAFRRVGDGYADGGEVRGVHVAKAPFPLTLRLDDLD